jgi:ankyrin repeat protein
MYRLQQWARRGVRVTTAEPLCSAAECGILNVVLILVRESGEDVSHVTFSEMPLMLAAVGGHLAEVRCLDRAGADVNQVSHYWTALIVAARRRQLAVVRCLLEFGAQVDAVDASGETALLASAEEG